MDVCVRDPGFRNLRNTRNLLSTFVVAVFFFWFLFYFIHDLLLFIVLLFFFVHSFYFFWMFVFDLTCCFIARWALWTL